MTKRKINRFVRILNACGALVLQPVIDTAQMFPHGATAKLIDFAHDTIEEISVMAHQYHCAVKCLQGLFQYILAAHIQMVGRLVKDKQINRLQ